jgi:MGT family glycosyltransferase
MSCIVLATFGSLGSVHPYLALAQGLKARGHTVRVAAGESYRVLIQEHGLDFRPVRPDRTTVTEDREVSRRSTQMRTGSKFAVKNLLRYAQQTYDDLLDACQNADLFISHPAAFSGPLVAEKLELPWLSVALAPATLFSACDPPVLPSLPWLAQIPRCNGFPHSLIFRAFKAATRGWMKPIDELRERVGLPANARHPFFEGMFSPFGTLALFSNTFAARQPDWPSNTSVTGFVFYRSPAGEKNPEVDAFLEQGDPPVVFTLGSNVVREAGTFYQESYRAARQIGCRAIFLAGGNAIARDTDEPPRQILVTDYAPYHTVFPRVAAVVHQGGIGTTAEAMASGLPMLIVPHVHDQPDNAFRARKLGIAREEARAKYCAESAAMHLKALLTQSQYKDRARSVQAQIRAEDGVNAACAAIETVLSRTATRTDRREAFHG